MTTGNASRTGIEIQVRVVVEAADLRSAGLIDAITRSVKLRPPARCDASSTVDFVALEAEFISGNEPGDAGAENNDARGPPCSDLLHNWTWLHRAIAEARAAKPRERCATFGQTPNWI